MEKDVSETDRFDRLLRYVYVDDVMVNAQLVAEGYARVSTFPPDVKYAEDSHMRILRSRLPLKRSGTAA